jgi:ribose transport system ATP-binding protein
VTLKGAFKAVDLKLFAGRICSIVGTNGSGRDELCKLAFGAISSTSGSIYIRGQKVHKWNIVDAIAAGIGFVPAERKVEGMIPGLSAAANLSLIFDQDSKFGPLTITSKEIAVADQWFEKLDVRPRKPRENLDRFSGGNQQKVVIAKWLKSEDLSLLVLDHPLRGLDPGAAGTVNQLIKDAALSGTAILLVGDTLEEALQMSDEIIVMKDGEISAHFDLHNQQPSTFDLLERMV